VEQDLDQEIKHQGVESRDPEIGDQGLEPVGREPDLVTENQEPGIEGPDQEIEENLIQEKEGLGLETDGLAPETEGLKIITQGELDQDLEAEDGTKRTGTDQEVEKVVPEAEL